MDCSWFDEHFPRRVVGGRYSCTGNHTPPAVARRPRTDGGDPFATEDDEGLSKGTRAGIGAGVGVGVILAVGFSVWAFLGWRSKKAVAGTPTGAEIGKVEVDGTGRIDLPGHELGAGAVPEPRAHQLDMSPRPRTPELGDTGVIAELP